MVLSISLWFSFSSFSPRNGQSVGTSYFTQIHLNTQIHTGSVNIWQGGEREREQAIATIRMHTDVNIHILARLWENTDTRITSKYHLVCSPLQIAHFSIQQHFILGSSLLNVWFEKAFRLLPWLIKTVCALTHRLRTVNIIWSRFRCRWKSICSILIVIRNGPKRIRQDRNKKRTTQYMAQVFGVDIYISSTRFHRFHTTTKM